MSRPSLVPRLQGAVIAHTLASHVGCPHTAAALAQWCIDWRRRRHPTGPHPDDWVRMWDGYLRGRPLVQWYQAELLSDITELRGAVDNPLWAVLRALWEGLHLVPRLHLTSAGRPCMLPMHAEAAMRRLCGCPDWRDLGIVLAILGSRSARWSAHRRWLCKHLLTYLELVCLGEPGCFVREQLYELLDALYRRHRFGEIEQWPNSFGGFEQGCLSWAGIADQMGLRPTSSVWDLQSGAVLGRLWAMQPLERGVGTGQASAAVCAALTPAQYERVRAVVRTHQADHYDVVLLPACLGCDD